MPIAPPAEALLDLPAMSLMDLYGRVRSLTDDAGFSGVLPAIWQCSDESQSIKKALFGYVYNCPSFNLGRVGGLLDPTRLTTASHHGRDLVIVGGSHIGAEESDGVGYIERVHGEVVPCCGMLRRVLDDYLQAWRRAARLIRLSAVEGHCRVEIPYKYLFVKPPSEQVRIRILLDRLVIDDALGEGSLGKIYSLHPRFIRRHPGLARELEQGVRPIGDLLDPESFCFSKRLDPDSHEPFNMLENSLFDFMPEIVVSKRPHRRLCDVNTWRQFHRLVSYITDGFEGSGRNIFVLAGLTVDHSVRHNRFIPQFGFWMEQGQALEARYFNTVEVNGLLAEQEIYRPPLTFLEYANI